MNCPRAFYRVALTLRIVGEMLQFFGVYFEYLEKNMLINVVVRGERFLLFYQSFVNLYLSTKCWRIYKRYSNSFVSLFAWMCLCSYRDCFALKKTKQKKNDILAKNFDCDILKPLRCLCHQELHRNLNDLTTYMNLWSLRPIFWFKKVVKNTKKD